MDGVTWMVQNWHILLFILKYVFILILLSPLKEIKYKEMEIKANFTNFINQFYKIVPNWLKRLFKQEDIAFILLSIVGTIIDIIVYSILSQILPQNIANFIGYWLGVVITFSLNMVFNYLETNKSIKAYLVKGFKFAALHLLSVHIQNQVFLELGGKPVAIIFNALFIYVVKDVVFGDIIKHHKQWLVSELLLWCLF